MRLSENSSCVAVPMTSEYPQVMSPNSRSSLRISPRNQRREGNAELDAHSLLSCNRHLGGRILQALLRRQWAVLLGIIGSIGRPLTVVVGGSRSMDKIRLVEILIEKVDEIIICGCVAYTFLRLCSRVVTETNSTEVGISDRIWQLIARAKTVGCKMTLPVDWIFCSEDSGDQDVKLFSSSQGVPGPWTAMDCGHRSRELFAESVRQAEAVNCFGSTGTMVEERFCKGTRALMKAMADLQASGRVSVLADCELEAVDAKWQLDESNLGAEFFAVQTRQVDVHSAGMEVDSRAEEPHWFQVGVGRTCGESVGSLNEIPSSRKPPSGCRGVEAVTSTSTCTRIMHLPVKPAYDPKVNHNSAQSSMLTAVDIQSNQVLVSAPGKQDHSENVVGLFRV